MSFCLFEIWNLELLWDLRIGISNFFKSWRGRSLRKVAMEQNPFAVLSLIVAPAILTNATSVLIMSTSNRLARAVDRTRELSKQLEATTDLSTTQAQRRLGELTASENRSLLLVRSLRSCYVALGGFALAALLSLLGAASVPAKIDLVVMLLEIGGICAGVIAVGSLVRGSTLLLRETQIAVQVVTDRAATLHARAHDGGRQVEG
jgi:hypothetical protein